MARKRKPKGPSRVAESLPNAAELLGRVVSRLGLPDARDADVLRERNHQRFLAGETKSPKVVDAVLSALASVLVNHGYLETAYWPTDLGFPTPEMLVHLALRDLRARWDLACVRVRGGALRGASLGPIMRTAAQLVVIDLAVRGGAWLVLSDQPGRDAPGIPTTEAVMEFVVKKSGRTAPDLARKLGVERTAVDDWRKGSRPSEANIELVSKLLAEGEPEWAQRGWWHLLRRNLAVAEILKDLDATKWFVGRSAELWPAFWVIASGVAWRLRSQEDEVDDDTWSRSLTGLVMRGSEHPLSTRLLNDLRAGAPDAWQSDLVAGPNWTDRLWLAAGIGQSVANVKLPDGLPEELRELASDPSFREMVATHILGAPTAELAPPGKYDGWECIRIKEPPPIAAENRRMQAGVAASHGRFDVAVAHLRRAVELVPAHDTAHLELGAALWQAGDVEGGIAECWIAVGLKPDWELPKVEIGIALIHARRYAEAREHLDAVHSASTSPSTHLKFNVATARWRCGAFADALTLLEEVLSDEGYASYPNALDQAAHCSFMVGDDVRGRALAKQARDLGRDETYRRWAAGGYRKANKDG